MCWGVAPLVGFIFSVQGDAEREMLPAPQQHGDLVRDKLSSTIKLQSEINTVHEVLLKVLSTLCINMISCPWVMAAAVSTHEQMCQFCLSVRVR